MCKGTARGRVTVCNYRPVQGSVVDTSVLRPCASATCKKPLTEPPGTDAAEATVPCTRPLPHGASRNPLPLPFF